MTKPAQTPVVNIANVEVRCPRCGSSCSVKNRLTNEYACAHCGSTFRFMDPTQKTVIHGTLAHNCPSCGAPVKEGEGYVCKECGKDWLCPKCVRKASGKYLCTECLKSKTYISGSDLSCPKCNGNLTYIKQYNRWYCYPCQTYPTHLCPDCGSPIEYQKKYEEFYCHKCRKYPSLSSQGPTQSQSGTLPTVMVVQQSSGYACSKCGGALTYINQHKRWYCHNCRRYE